MKTGGPLMAAAPDNAGKPVRDTARASRSARGSLARKIALVSLLFGIVIASSVAAVLLWSNARTIDRIERLANDEAIQRASVTLTDTIGQLRTDALILANTPPTLGLYRAIENGGVDPTDGSSAQLWKDRLAQIFASFMQARTEYFQIRLISASGEGMELVRVERVDGAPFRIGEAGLQAKGDRPYFQATLGMEAGSVYLSEFELNQEFGRIEQPLRPTIRAATPIYDPRGDLFAMVVVNVDAEYYFEQIDGVFQSSQDLLIANEAGDYLYHPDPARTFGFDLGERHFIQDDFPPLAEAGPVFDGVIDGPGGPGLLFARHIAFDPDQPQRYLTIGLVSPTLGLRQIVFNPENRLLLAVVFTVILAVSALAVILFNVLGRALGELTSAAEKLERGNYDIDLSALRSRGDETGELARAFGTMADVIRARERTLLERSTALETANRNLTVSSALSSAVMESAIDGLIVIDERGIIQEFNPAAARMFGYRPEEVVGANVSVLMPEPHRTAHDAYLANHMRTGISNIIGIGREVMACRKDGETIPIQLGIAPMMVGDKKLFLGTTSDLSRQKAIERQKEQRFIEELRRSNEELSQFAYIASHDLQEPLRVVGSYVDLLGKRYRGKLDAEADEFIDFAVDGVTRMKALINDILAYSRVSHDAISEEIVDTNGVVDRIVTSFGQRIEEAGATIVYEDLPAVHADPMQVERLFRNLIDNAIKYRSGRPLTIRVEAVRAGERWQFTVADNGIGIDPRFKDKIFGIFTRLHGRDVYSGTGIGLASCRRIVERHGGTISVEPEADGGSAFRFTLPAA